MMICLQIAAAIAYVIVMQPDVQAGINKYSNKQYPDSLYRVTEKQYTLDSISIKIIQV